MTSRGHFIFTSSAMETNFKKRACKYWWRAVPIFMRRRLCLRRPGPQAKAARLHGLHMVERRTFTHDRRTANGVKFAQSTKTTLFQAIYRDRTHGISSFPETLAKFRRRILNCRKSSVSRGRKMTRVNCRTLADSRRNKRNRLQRTIVTSTLARHLIWGKLEKSAVSIAGAVTVSKRYRTTSGSPVPRLPVARVRTTQAQWRMRAFFSAKFQAGLSNGVAAGIQSSPSRSLPSFVYCNGDSCPTHI